jgi:hypothetical protein
MTRLLVAAAILLSGCKFPLCLTMQGKTDLVIVGTPAQGADRVIAAAKRLAPCETRPFVGQIEWVEEAFPVVGLSGLAAGASGITCAISVKVLRIEPATKSALAHEIGHWVWRQCYDRPGERRMLGGYGVILDPDFEDWVTRVNAAASSGE